jgi:hypothetical protein
MFGAPGPISQLFNLEQVACGKKLADFSQLFEISSFRMCAGPVASGVEMKTLPVNLW